MRTYKVLLNLRNIFRSPFAGRPNIFWYNKELSAECFIDHEENPPVVGCVCGIYSKKTIEGLIKDNYYKDMRSGTILVSLINWGDKIIEGETGIRSSHARIEEILIPIGMYCKDCGCIDNSPVLTYGKSLLEDMLVIKCLNCVYVEKHKEQEKINIDYTKHLATYIKNFDLIYGERKVIPKDSLDYKRLFYPDEYEREFGIPVKYIDYREITGESSERTEIHI